MIEIAMDKQEALREQWLPGEEYQLVKPDIIVETNSKTVKEFKAKENKHQTS